MDHLLGALTLVAVSTVVYLAKIELNKNNSRKMNVWNSEIITKCQINKTCTEFLQDF